MPTGADFIHIWAMTVRKAEVKITFADQQQPLYKDPEVKGLWPEGDFTYNESEVNVNDSGCGGTTFGGGAAGMQLGLNGSWTRNVGKKRTERASVNGARRNGEAGLGPEERGSFDLGGKQRP